MNTGILLSHFHFISLQNWATGNSGTPKKQTLKDIFPSKGKNSEKHRRNISLSDPTRSRYNKNRFLP